MSRKDHSFIKTAPKPSAMALRLIDKLCSKEVLSRSTVQGSREFDALEHGILAAIKGEIKKDSVSHLNAQVNSISPVLSTDH